MLPHAPEQLFALVGDVAAYPQFVPWITAMRTWNPRVEGPVRTVDAEAQVGFSFLRESFATRVRCDSQALTVDVGLLYGPFKQLRNHWKFLPHSTGTSVEFSIEFAFKSRLLDGLLVANLDRAANRLIGCFEDRARQVYGAAAVAGPSA